MHVARTMAVILAAVLFGGLGAGSGRAQTSLDTQKGAPPAQNANAPEYAPTPLTPAKPSAIEPVPGKPGLAPAPGATSTGGQADAAAKGRTILGVHPLTAFIVGLGILGAAVLVFGAMTARPARWRAVGQKYRSRHK
jgi:hypothetical protein